MTEASMPDRDSIGYAARLPRVRWPGDARADGELRPSPALATEYKTVDAPGTVRKKGAIAVVRSADGQHAELRTPTGALPAGLLPVAFSIGRRRVRLFDLRGVECREQSLRQTVERWAAEHPDRVPIEMDLAAYVAAARQTRLPAPAGFLFNVARCGSTLLANMLAAPAGHVAIKESGTVGILLRRLMAATDAAEHRTLAELLTVTLPLFGCLAGSAPAPRLFIKPHSWATIAASALRVLFPATPAVFLYREPGAVVASMLARAPYGGFLGVPRERIVAEFPSLADAPRDLSPAALYAHVWRSPVEAALAWPAGAVLLLDYAELTGQPEQTVLRLLDRVGVQPSPETVAAMLATTQVYSKDASGRTAFDAARTHRRPPLDAAQQAEVRSVVGDLYDRLTARRQAETRRLA